MKDFRNKLLLILCSLIFSEQVAARTLSIDKSTSFISKKYNKLHKAFSRKMCKPGTEEKFNRLDKDFRGMGNYIPILPNSKLDKKTIRNNLKYFKQKIKWIKGNISRLKKKKNFKNERKELKKFKKQINVLLKYKKEYFENDQLIERTQAKNKSNEVYSKLKDDFLSFVYRRDYLLGFKYPVNHFELRRKYDRFKNSKKMKEKQQANSTYFYRKLVEDGAQDPNHSRNDIYTRANLNTIILNLRKPSAIISENIRYDFENIIGKLDYTFNRGVTQQIKRNQEWLKRVKHSYKFYKDILKNKVKIGNHYETGLDIVKHKSEALSKLKRYVLDKQAQTYIFWMKQDPLLRKVFALETILMNEVGRLDVKGALERKDVSQVVINRSTDKEYSQFKKSDSLYGVLKNKYKITDEKLSSYPWLNVLFKEGEFSFTYFFIKASLRTFCADMTYIGRKLRNENVYIGINLLKQPNTSFDAVRYFSRASMLGRIDMAHLWSGFWPLAERPGKRIFKKGYLLQRIRSGKYRFLYNFRSSDKRLYEVIDIKNKSYSYDPLKKRLFHYRNPHYFTYFRSSSD